MLNTRTLYPPLFRPVDSGGGGDVREKIAEIDSQITRIDSQITDISGDITQIDSVITRLSNNVGDLSQLDTTDKSSLVGAVNEVAGSGGGINFDTTETVIGTYKGKDLYARVYENLEQAVDVSSIGIDRIIGCFYNFIRSNGLEGYVTPHSSYYATIRYAVSEGIVTSITPTNNGGASSIVLLYTKAN